MPVGPSSASVWWAQFPAGTVCLSQQKIILPAWLWKNPARAAAFELLRGPMNQQNEDTDWISTHVLANQTKV